MSVQLLARSWHTLSMKDLSDLELVDRCRSGDEKAWAALVHRYKAVIHSICRAARLDADDADDVFLDCFARLLEKLSTMEHPERVRSWLVTTARRRVIDRLRAVARERPLEGAQWAQVADPETAIDERISSLQRRDLVHRGVASLGDRCRELLTLLYFEGGGLAYEEVAARLSLAIGSIGPLRARCLERLRSALEPMAAS